MTSLCLHHNETDKVRHFEFEKKGHGYSFEAAEVMHCIVNKKIESDAMSHAFSLLLIETLDAIRHKTGIVYSEDKIRP